MYFKEHFMAVEESSNLPLALIDPSKYDWTYSQKIERLEYDKDKPQQLIENIIDCYYFNEGDSYDGEGNYCIDIFVKRIRSNIINTDGIFVECFDDFYCFEFLKNGNCYASSSNTPHNVISSLYQQLEQKLH